MKFKALVVALALISTLLLPAALFAVDYVLSVTTDKASYTAGENVQISGSLTKDGAPLSFAALALTVSGPAGDIIYVNQVNTDSSGAYQHTYPLPSTALAGAYLLQMAGVDVNAQIAFAVGTIQDTTPPSSQIVTPANGANLASTLVLVSGTATDNVGLRKVEISTNGGSSWALAGGTANWRYEWVNPTNGSYTLLSRATDLAGNVEIPGSGAQVSVNISPSPTPTLSPSPSPTPTPTPSATPSLTSSPTPTSTPTPSPSPTSTPTSSPTPSMPTFLDISTHWGRAAIENLVTKGLINGYPDGFFRPDNPITRAEFTKILALALNLGLVAPSEAQFSDVPQDFWGYPYVETAAAAGIVNGVGQGLFEPGRNITRADLALMIGRALGLTPQSVEQFSDAAQIPAYAAGMVGAVSAKEIVTGYPDGSFRPLNPATRAEAATMIFRMLSNPG